MNKQLTMLAAGFAGAGLMYFLDPILGRRRRARVADKAGHYSRKMKHAMDLTARDVGHRVQGVVARGKRAFDNTEVPGEVLIERVRSELGRVISHPSAISVSVSVPHHPMAPASSGVSVTSAAIHSARSK